MHSEATVIFTDVAVLADTGEAFVCRLDGKTVRVPTDRIHPASDLARDDRRAQQHPEARALATLRRAAGRRPRGWRRARRLRSARPS